MEKHDEWIKEYDCLTINKKKHWFKCSWAFDRKAPNDTDPSLQLVFIIYKETVGWIEWEDFKGSYMAEKFRDYVKNTLNGQRAVYWDNKNERSFK